MITGRVDLFHVQNGVTQGSNAYSVLRYGPVYQNIPEQITKETLFALLDNFKANIVEYHKKNDN